MTAAAAAAEPTTAALPPPSQGVASGAKPTVTLRHVRMQAQEYRDMCCAWLHACNYGPMRSLLLCDHTFAPDSTPLPLRYQAHAHATCARRLVSLVAAAAARVTVISTMRMTVMVMSVQVMVRATGQRHQRRPSAAAAVLQRCVHDSIAAALSQNIRQAGVCMSMCVCA